MRDIQTYFLPALVDPEDLKDRVVVVVDVLRATTTIVYALAAGAESVIPCLEVDEALQLATRLGPSGVLGGERGGVRISGFQLGNSPLEYTPASVGGKVVIFTTTNGTRALRHARLARRILVGAFVNLSAVCDVLATESRIAILCAGTNQEITREDVLFAGAVAHGLDVNAAAGDRLNDQTALAVDAWRRLMEDFAGVQLLATGLRQSSGGRNLIEIGQERDIDIAASVDQYSVVPEVSSADGTVRLR